METPQQVIAKLPQDFFAKNSMSRLENVLAGVSLPIAINGLIGSVVDYSIKTQNQKCDNNAVALMDPYLPNALPILRSATAVSEDKWNMPGVPNPYSLVPTVMDLTIACIGMAQKQGSGVVRLSVPYNWYTYTMKIPRADGSIVTMPMIIAYKPASGYNYWDNVKCFVVCKPSAQLSVVPKDWTTFPNMFEVTNIVWPIVNPNRVVNPNPYRPASQPNLKFVITNVKIQNDKTNPTAVQKLVDFANASTFASSNIAANGSLNSSALQLQMTGGITTYSTTNSGSSIPSRVPFTDPQKELLWGIGNACTANTLIRQANYGDPDCRAEVITLVNYYLANHPYVSTASPSVSTTPAAPAASSPTATATAPATAPATATAPAPATAPVPAFQLPVTSRGYNPGANPYKPGTIRIGGTKRRSKQSRPHHKKRSRKQRSYKKRSDKRKRY